MKKVSVSYGNLLLFQINNFKNRSFLSGQGVVQNEPNSVWSIPCVVKRRNRSNFWYSLHRKKVSFSYGTFWISRKRNFKNRSFSSGQAVVQINANPVWSIPCVVKRRNRSNFWYSLHRKKVSFSYGTFWISRKRNFKNRSFYRIKKLFKSNQTWYGVSPGYVECKTERFFALLG